MHTTDFLVSEALARETEKLSCLKEMTQMPDHILFFRRSYCPEALKDIVR